MSPPFLHVVNKSAYGKPKNPIPNPYAKPAATGQKQTPPSMLRETMVTTNFSAVPPKTPSCFVGTNEGAEELEMKKKTIF